MKKLLCALLSLCLCLCGCRLYDPSVPAAAQAKLPAEYEVQGVDVSEYQGSIDWPVLAGQGLNFAYIKATEGIEYVDPHYAVNWEQAGQTHLRTGAYHFFTFATPGAAQADNFIRTVNARAGMLPPAVDVELYGDTAVNLPDVAAVRQNLHALLDKLEGAYGMIPVLYCSDESYEIFLAEGFEQYPIWLCNVVSDPVLPDARPWAFWQYSITGSLNGYSGREDHIDLDVFYGTAEEFAAFGTE